MRFHLAFIFLTLVTAVPQPEPLGAAPAIAGRDAEPLPVTAPNIPVAREEPITDERSLELLLDERSLDKRDATGRCLGSKKPKSKGVKINPNGCGPGGKLGDLVPEGYFGGCCNNHDICYSTCSRSRFSCDNSFLGCMNSVCNDKFSGWRKIPKNVACKARAVVYYGAVRKLGLIPFARATKKHCKCV